MHARVHPAIPIDAFVNTLSICTLDICNNNSHMHITYAYVYMITSYTIRVDPSRYTHPYELTYFYFVLCLIDV
jgi:hypothetical protein